MVKWIKPSLNVTQDIVVNTWFGFFS